MVKKLHKSSTVNPASALGGTVKDSAQQIFQAGLGAFAKAQVEGAKALETLVKDSATIQRKTKAAAEGKISEATTKMTHMANDISKQASGQWDKLENIFEERVAKALNKLGVPSAKDVSALIERIDALNKAVQTLAGKSGTPAANTNTPKTRAKSDAKPAVKAPAAKKAAAKKVPKTSSK